MANIGAALRYHDHWKSAAEVKALRDDRPSSFLQVAALKPLLPAGLRRGTILEISGPRSSGRTSLSHHLLAQATAEGEICAIVDLCDSFHPTSAALAGVDLKRLVWVRCGGNPEHAMRICDLLLHAGGFGIVTLDLCEAHPRSLNRIPLSYWYRFRRAIEETPTVLLVCADLQQAKSCANNGLQTQTKALHWQNNAPFSLLRGLEIHAALGKVSSLRPQSLFLPAVA